MYGVDRGDQYRECGGGFAKKAHYKKWYKKAYFAVLDFMLLNGFFAWNMSAKENPNLERMKVKKSAFYAAVAEEMIAFTEDDDAWVNDEACPAGVLNDHIPVPAVASDRRHCIVCKMEEGWRRKAGLKDVRGMNSRSQNAMAVCSCAQCAVVAHTLPMGHDRKIFQDERFVGMSCWEIAHSSECKGIWSVTESAGGSSVRRDGNEVKAKSYSMKRSHQIVKDMANEYGHRERRPRRRINRDVEDDQICRDCEIE